MTPEEWKDEVIKVDSELRSATRLKNYYEKQMRKAKEQLDFLSSIDPMQIRMEFDEDD